MKCPVCNRNLAPTLSICLTCGAMMNDTVREELQTKIAPSSRLPVIEPKAEPKVELSAPPKPIILETRPQPAPPPKRVDTANLRSPKTSPTLVEFQHKNNPIPEWRLQMQNAVRQRKGAGSGSESPVNTVSGSQTQHTTHGANALKVEPVEAPLPPELDNADPRLKAAMNRIAQSRQAFLPEDARRTVPASAKPAKSFPFNVVAPTPNQPVRPPLPINTPVVRPKPEMVSPLRMEKKLDTNKLPRIETVINDATVKPPVVETEITAEAEFKRPEPMPAQTEFSEVKRILINAERRDDEETELTDVFGDEIEDLAPFSMRFNAGIFDLIIGIFASMVILSPFAFSGGAWFSLAGMLTFSGTCSIVLFLYMTSCIGFFGKTLGMRLFSLELVDAEENEYPTIHQAAVSSSLYILSLALGGLGFITVFFNEERRAIHDLLSGTIIVREF